jgi:phosphate-selective porin OprO/OprP
MPPPFACFLAGLGATLAASDWSLSASMNVQHDWLQYRADRIDLGDANDIRRARFALTAKYDKTLELKAEYDAEATVWTDAFARWSFGGGHALRAGQFKVPIYLDELTSDKVTLLMEQAAPTAFAIGRRLGVDYAWVAPHWTLAAMAFGQNLQGLNDGEGYAVRGTWLPLQGERGFLHLGAAVVTESPDAGTARFAPRPEAGLAGGRLVDTGTLRGVDRIDRIGLEAAWVQGPWLLQSEYIAASVDRTGGGFRGDGYYAQAGWLPFGQARGYKNGVIDAPKGNGTGPAIELGLRFSRVDLDDGAVGGGTQTALGAGVTWWLRGETRLMANWIRLDSERRAVADNPNVLEFRAQMAF